jgi:putative DNA primase/helicase
VIPRELQAYNQWVCWVRPHGTTTKLPICPASCKPASCTDPETWGTYRQAQVAASRFPLDGIGFVFTNRDPYTGVDLDHCRTVRGDLEPRAAEIVRHLNSYTEWSPSGEGLHIFVKASLAERTGLRSRGIEIYSAGRYFTVTGAHFEQTPSRIENRQAEVVDLVGALSKKNHPRAEFSRPAAHVTQSDEELIRRAVGARNGSKFQRLWAGDTSDYGGDHSRADAALCTMLAYYTNGDQARIDRLFRMSRLYRQKWDRPTAQSTYGSLTIGAVIRNGFSHR